MYKLRLDPEQVRGVSPNVYDVVTMYEEQERCDGCSQGNLAVSTVVKSDVADLIRLDLDSGVAVVIGRMQDDFHSAIVRANPGDVVTFPCGCVVKVLDVDLMADLCDEDAEPWDVEYASVHVIDER